MRGKARVRWLGTYRANYVIASLDYDGWNMSTGIRKVEFSGQ